MTARRPAAGRPQRGFTLAELAVVMAILVLLIGGLLMTFSAQTSVREVRDTQRTLELAREALLGFATSNGRLPCPAPAPPAPATAPGPFAVEIFVDPITAPPSRNLQCGIVNGEGFLPALTLGIGPTDRYGYLLDAWGNPIRYAVTPVITNGLGSDITRCPPNAPWPAPPATPTVLLDYSRCPLFTTSNALVTLGYSVVQALPPPPAGMLRVCPNAGCPVGTFIATPAVVWSLGKNFQTTGGVSADEQANTPATAGDGTFVYREPSPAGAAGGEFDDILIWIPAAVLYGRLIAAGGA